MSKNITVTQLIQFLIDVEFVVYSGYGIEDDSYNCFFTSFAKEVMRREYIENTSSDSITDVDSQEYADILQEAKEKVRVEVGVDIDNPPKDIATTILRRSPLYLLPKVIEQFQAYFTATDNRLTIAYNRFEYIVESDIDELLRQYDEYYEEVFYGSVNLEDIFDCARDALMYFLAKTKLPSSIELRFAACLINSGYVLSTIVDVLLKMLQKKDKSKSVSILLENALLDLLEELERDNPDDYNDEKMESHFSNFSSGDGMIDYDKIIRYLSEHSVCSRTLDILFHKLIHREPRPFLDYLLREIIDNSHFDKSKLLHQVRSSLQAE